MAHIDLLGLHLLGWNGASRLFKWVPGLTLNDELSKVKMQKNDYKSN